MLGEVASSVCLGYFFICVNLRPSAVLSLIFSGTLFASIRVHSRLGTFLDKLVQCFPRSVGRHHFRERFRFDG